MEYVINQVQSILSRYYKNGNMSEISIKDTLTLMLQKEKLENQIAVLQVSQTESKGNIAYYLEKQLQTTRKNLLKSAFIFIIALIVLRALSIPFSTLFAFIISLICMGAMEKKSHNVELEQSTQFEEEYTEKRLCNASEEINVLKQNIKVIEQVINESSVVPIRFQTKHVILELISYRNKGFCRTDNEAISRYIKRNFSYN